MSISDPLAVSQFILVLVCYVDTKQHNIYGCYYWSIRCWLGVWGDIKKKKIYFYGNYFSGICLLLHSDSGNGPVFGSKKPKLTSLFSHLCQKLTLHTEAELFWKIKSHILLSPSSLLWVIQRIINGVLGEVGWPLAVTRPYSWHCAQESLQAVFRRPNVVPEIEPMSVMHSKQFNSCPSVLALWSSFCFCNGKIPKTFQHLSCSTEESEHRKHKNMPLLVLILLVWGNIFNLKWVLYILQYKTK